MKKYAMLLIGFMTIVSSLQACVTYNPATRTYTVDQSGNVKLKNKNK